MARKNKVSKHLANARAAKAKLFADKQKETETASCFDRSTPETEPNVDHAGFMMQSFESSPSTSRSISNDAPVPVPSTSASSRSRSTSDTPDPVPSTSTSSPTSVSDTPSTSMTSTPRSRSIPKSTSDHLLPTISQDQTNIEQTELLSRSHQKKKLCEKYDIHSTSPVDEAAAEGNVIVSLISLNKFIAQFKCLLCKNSKTMYTKVCCTKGLANQIDVRCRLCEESVTKWWTSETSGTGKSQFYTINRDTVFASLAMGMGAEKSKNFCEYLNLSALHHRAFQIHANSIYNLNDEVRRVLFQKSADIVRKEHLALDSRPEDGNETLNIAVSYDGSWLTRGHTSLVGLGCIIDVLTGLVIDSHVMNSYCQVCSRIAKIPLEDERKRKEEDHIGSGKCSANFHGKIFYIY